MPVDPLALPVDDRSAAALAAEGLRMTVIDGEDPAAAADFVRAYSRGFHDPEPADEQLATLVAELPAQRSVVVHDDGLEDRGTPIATVTSWPAPLTLPGGEVTGWAISDVTVAPTHRRRGIARAMLEAELRTASAAGLPVAMLTVSEATIYGRYGFGVAAWATELEVDALRAGWVGAPTPGRVQLVGRDAAMASGRTIVDAARRDTPGDVAATGRRFERLFGDPADAAAQRRRRFVRFDDADGVPRGLAVYTVEEDAAARGRFIVDVQHLATTTDDAYRALWRFLLEIDLVSRVRAHLRSVDEPLRWLVRDPRAVRTTEVRDHLWVRVLDPVAAFGGRTVAEAGRLGLRVADPQGFADGAWTIEADAAGRPSVTAGIQEAGPLLDLPVDVLGPLLLGGASAAVLAAAGRLRERTPGDAAAADRLLRPPTPPRLTTWF